MRREQEFVEINRTLFFSKEVGAIIRAGAFIRINTMNTLLFNVGNYFFTRKIPCFRDCYNYVSFEALIGYTEQNLFLA